MQARPVRMSGTVELHQLPSLRDRDGASPAQSTPGTSPRHPLAPGPMVATPGNAPSTAHAPGFNSSPRLLFPQHQPAPSTPSLLMGAGNSGSSPFLSPLDHTPGGVAGDHDVDGLRSRDEDHTGTGDRSYTTEEQLVRLQDRINGLTGAVERSHKTQTLLLHQVVSSLNSKSAAEADFRSAIQEFKEASLLAQQVKSLTHELRMAKLSNEKMADLMDENDKFLQARDEEAQALRNDLVAVKAQHSRQYDNLKRWHDESQLQLQQTQEELNWTTSQNRTLEQKVVVLDHQLQQTLTDKALTESDNRTLTQRLLELEHQLHAAQERASSRATTPLHHPLPNSQSDGDVWMGHSSTSAHSDNVLHLQQQMQDMQREHAAATSELERKLQEATDALTLSRAAEAVLVKELDAARSTHEMQAAASATELCVLRDELAAARATAEALRTEATEAVVGREGLRAELSAMAVAGDMLRAEAAEATAVSERLRADLAAAELVASGLSGHELVDELAALKRELEAVQSAYCDATAEASKLRSKLQEQSAAALETAASRAAEQEVTMAAAAAAARGGAAMEEALQQQIVVLKAELEERSEELAAARDAAAQLDAEACRQALAAQKVNASHAALTRELQATRQQLEARTAQLQSAQQREAQLTARQRRLEAAEQQLNTTKAELQAARDREAVLTPRQRLYEEAQQELAAARAAAAAAEEQKAAVSTAHAQELEALQRSVDSATKGLADAEQAAAARQQELAAMQAQLATAQTTLTESVSCWRDTEADAARRLADLESQLTYAEEQRNQLQEALDARDAAQAAAATLPERYCSNGEADGPPHVEQQDHYRAKLEDARTTAAAQAELLSSVRKEAQEACAELQQRVADLENQLASQETAAATHLASRASLGNVDAAIVSAVPLAAGAADANSITGVSDETLQAAQGRCSALEQELALVRAKLSALLDAVEHTANEELQDVCSKSDRPHRGQDLQSLHALLGGARTTRLLHMRADRSACLATVRMLQAQLESMLVSQLDPKYLTDAPEASAPSEAALPAASLPFEDPAIKLYRQHNAAATTMMGVLSGPSTACSPSGSGGDDGYVHLAFGGNGGSHHGGGGTQARSSSAGGGAAALVPLADDPMYQGGAWWDLPPPEAPPVFTRIGGGADDEA